MKTRVLVADDHKILRQGLRSLLDESGDFEVIGEAENGRETLRLAKLLKPTVVLMDVAMAELNGIEATRRLVNTVPEIKVLALSMHSDSRYVKRMLEAGASGYLVKENAFDELLVALRAVIGNRIYVSAEASSGLLQEVVGQRPIGDDDSDSPLTGRETETLQLIAEGYSTQDIAARLFVSVKTVETHRKNIMKKLDLRSVAELTKYAIRKGITMLGD